LGKKTKIFLIVAVVALILAMNVVAFKQHLRKVHEIPMPISTTSPVKVASEVLIVVLSDSSCSLSGVTIEMSSLTSRLAAAKADGVFSVRIKAAPGVSFDAIRVALDFVRRAGVEEVSVETR
jgi:biopolymer transport protein ExbD